MIPLHLIGFDYVTSLVEWKTHEPSRRWSLSSIGNNFECRIKWDYDEQIWTIAKVAASLEEATWLALEEFRKTE